MELDAQFKQMQKDEFERTQEHLCTLQDSETLQFEKAASTMFE